MLNDDTQNELNTQIQYRLIEKLAASEKYHRDLIQSLQEIIFECDVSGNIDFLNRAWEKILGHSIQEVMGRSILDFIDPRDQPLLTNIFNHQAQLTTSRLELRFFDSDGNTTWLEMSFRENSNQKFSGSLVNITDRKNTEILQQELNETLESRVRQRTNELMQSNQELRLTLEKLQKTQSQLIQAEKMSSLGQLIAGIAHEINNPISFIYGNLNFIKDYSLSLLEGINLFRTHYPDPKPEIVEWTETADLAFLEEDLPKTLDSIELGAERVREIILSLKSFSRTDEQGLKLVDIHQGLDDTLLILQNRLREDSGIEILKEYGCTEKIQCYPGQINQVFLNILANAIDALDNSAQPNLSKKIVISTGLIKKNKWVRISVTDNADGISEAVQSRIFDPFFTTKPIGKGTGMGMAISYQIITEKHGGYLKCVSQEMSGSQFLIDIPIAQSMKRDRSS